ncbi:hypothetical protein FRB90_001715 [Tulasnella sp. 427]|nr:hypothetical protein FRB90_001715 [Tulasnella sp. 427]
MAREKIHYHPYTSSSRPAALSQPQLHQHCLVCHQTFDPSTNTDGSCDIPHLWHSDAAVLDASFPGPDPRLVYFAKCCDAVHTSYLNEEDDDEYAQAYSRGQSCYVGHHIMDPEEFRELRKSSRLVFRSCGSMKCADGHGAWRFQEYLDMDHQVPLGYNATKTWDDEGGNGPAIDGVPYLQARVGRREDVERQVQRRCQEPACLRQE